MKRRQWPEAAPFFTRTDRVNDARPSPTPSPSQTRQHEAIDRLREQTYRQMTAERRAQIDYLINHDRYQSLYVTDYVNTPTAQQDLVAVTVPAGQVYAVDRIAVWFSEPLVPMCEAIGWTVTLDDAPTPHIYNASGTTRYFYHGYADPYQPEPIEPIHAGAGQKIAIRITPLISPGSTYITVYGVLAGQVLSK